MLLKVRTISTLLSKKNQVQASEYGDSRRTFVDKQSANIFGIRAGLGVSKKIETGIGIYSSNLFGILGSNVSKLYIDNSAPSPFEFQAEVGFHYFAVYGEYLLLSNRRLKLTTNTQIGLGYVDIDFATAIKEGRREIKSLIEHSIKAYSLRSDYEEPCELRGSSTVL